MNLYTLSVKNLGIFDVIFFILLDHNKAKDNMQYNPKTLNRKGKIEEKNLFSYILFLFQRKVNRDLIKVCILDYTQ